MAKHPKQETWVCGQCGYENPADATEMVCEMCDYVHGELKQEVLKNLAVSWDKLQKET